jgi:hypothetical protein
MRRRIVAGAVATHAGWSGTLAALELVEQPGDLRRQGCFDNVFEGSAEYRTERGYHQAVGIFLDGQSE